MLQLVLSRSTTWRSNKMVIRPIRGLAPSFCSSQHRFQISSWTCVPAHCQWESATQSLNIFFIYKNYMKPGFYVPSPYGYVFFTHTRKWSIYIHKWSIFCIKRKMTTQFRSRKFEICWCMHLSLSSDCCWHTPFTVFVSVETGIYNKLTQVATQSCDICIRSN